MGTINARGGRLFFDFRFKGKRCREYTKLQDSKANRKRAEKIMEKIEAEIALGLFDFENYFPESPRVDEFKATARKVARLRDGIPTFKEFAETWFRECEVGWRYSHKETVRRDLENHLKPQFGELLVHEISKADVLDFRAELGRKRMSPNRVGLAIPTINRIMVPLKMTLNEAASRFDFASPVRDIKSLKVPRSDVDPFTLQEVQRFLGAVREDFRAYYTVRFFSGMRTGEIDGLKWKYVDFDRRQILVRESLVMGQMDYTKNDHSQREIVMSQPVFDALVTQKELTAKYEFVFCNKEGNPLNYNNVSKRVWYPLLRHLEMPKRKPYQTRHTAATLWLAAGENPEWIARQMGHATTEMLFRVYSRYVPNLTRRDGSAFEALLAESTGKTDE